MGIGLATDGYAFPDAITKFSEARLRLTSPGSPPGPCKETAGQTGQRHKREPEQAALFLEFLRWKEEQSGVNSLAVEPLRATISP
jgi:hypothetical protein